MFRVAKGTVTHSQPFALQHLLLLLSTVKNKTKLLLFFILPPTYSISMNDALVCPSNRVGICAESNWSGHHGAMF